MTKRANISEMKDRSDELEPRQSGDGTGLTGRPSPSYTPNSHSGGDGYVQLPTHKVLARVAEAAEMLSISRSQVYRLIQAGVVPTVRLGASIRIPTDGLYKLAQQAEVRDDTSA